MCSAASGFVSRLTSTALVPFTAPLLIFLFAGSALSLSPLALGLKLVAICDRQVPRVHDTAKKYGVAGYSDYDKFLEHDMDGVVLANYFHEHTPFAIKALRAGKHVFVEKPFTASTAVIGRIVFQPWMATCPPRLSTAPMTRSGPTAAASATPTTGIARLAVTFSSAGSADSDGSISSYSWNFGVSCRCSFSGSWSCWI